MSRELKNKPLIEALMEIRWALQGEDSAPKTDPHFKILLGRLYDRVSESYPEVQQLPTARVPDEIFGSGVQHRFRAKKNGWPLIQVGPGILTVNSTDDYTWEDFNPRAVDAVEKLFEAYPKKSDLRVSSLVLRYIDAVEFDYNQHNAFTYIEQFLKVKFQLPPNLFAAGIQDRPTIFSWQTSHQCADPKGMVTLRFSSGQKDRHPAIVWETIIESAGQDLPAMPDCFQDWIDSAHDVTDDWFFKLIAGELERRFSGE